MILAPSKPLKLRQRWILDEILNKLPTNLCCHGFVQQRSIKTNAEMHVNKTQVHVKKKKLSHRHTGCM